MSPTRGYGPVGFQGPDTNTPALVVPIALPEVPLGFKVLPPSSVLPVLSTTRQADAGFSGPISTAQSALSGELQVVNPALPSPPNCLHHLFSLLMLMFQTWFEQRSGTMNISIWLTLV